MRTAVVAAALMGLAGIAGSALRPTHHIAADRAPVRLTSLVPTEFSGWREEASDIPIVNPQAKELEGHLYSDVLNRTYANSDGYRIMLSIAYGADQSRETQLHVPDVCYPAGGFEILSATFGRLRTPRGSIQVKRLVTSGRGRIEPVTYWTMIGDDVVQLGWRARLTSISYGLHGDIPDGLVFRVSSVDHRARRAFDIQQAFVADLVASAGDVSNQRIAGLK